MRVVSLVPSVTETLLAWGIEPVGVTRFCEQPGLFAVGGTKNPDLDAIVALTPDLVVVDEEENRLPDVEALRAAGVEVHVTAVRSVADVGPTLRSLAEAVAIDVPVPVNEVPDAPTGRVAFVPIWRRPWMTINGDTYGASMLQAVGIETAFASSPERYPVVTLDQVEARSPDLVLAPTEPYEFTEAHLVDLTNGTGAAQAQLVDGKDLFWWGVRTPAAIARLRELVASWTEPWS